MLSASIIALASILGASAFPVAVGPENTELLARNNGPVSGGLFPTGPYQQYMDPMKNTSVGPYPTYRALSNFDYASFNLGLYQEYIELDLFNYGLATFTAEEFAEAGMGPQETSLLRFMAEQETGHAQLLTDILGPGAAVGCTYNYSGAFSNVREYVDFNQRLTRWGESGVWGFLTSLNSRDSAQLLSQSIATEARQQMVFRQFTGAFPMPVYFESGIPQNWAWTLLAPYIQSCPATNPRVQWSNFPALTVENVAPLAYDGSQAAVSTNRSANIELGQQINLSWEDPGKAVGPNNSYITRRAQGDAKYALIVSMLNATYYPLENIESNSASFKFNPNPPVYDTEITGVAATGVNNGTDFIVITCDNPYVTPFNLTMVNNVLVAGPAILQSG